MRIKRVQITTIVAYYYYWDNNTGQMMKEKRVTASVLNWEAE